MFEVITSKLFHEMNSFLWLVIAKSCGMNKTTFFRTEFIGGQGGGEQDMFALEIKIFV